MPVSTRLLPNLYALAVFESAGRWSNFTRAAEELGITQPSVSRHVLQVEDRLGVQLFDRRHNSLQLTPAGQRLYRAVSLGYGHLRTELDAIVRSTAHRPLTLACTPAFFTHWLMPRFSLLRDAMGGQEIRVTLSEWFDELDANDTDLIIRWGQNTWPDREFVPFIAEDSYPICSRTFRDRFIGDVDLDRDPSPLLDLPLLHQYDGASGFQTWESWFSAHGIEYTRSDTEPVFSNFQLLLQAVREDQGVSLSWTYLTDDMLDDGELVCLASSVRNEATAYGLDMSLLNLPAWKRARLARWFRDAAPAQSRLPT